MTPSLSPAQQRIMRFMPLLFGLFFLTFPQALVVFVVVNLLLVALRWVSTRAS